MINRTGYARIITRLAITIMVFAGSTTSSKAASPETAAYARVLERFVTDDAQVRYAALKTDPTDLDGYLASLATLDPKGIEALSWYRLPKH